MNIASLPLTYLLITFLALVGIVHSTPVYAADPVAITVRVEAKPEPVRAVGLIFSSSGSQEIADTKINKIGDKLFQIEFSVDRSILHQDSVASAIAYDANGTASYANVTPALLSEARTLLESIPDCPAEDISKIAQLTSPGTLQQLVDVRAERAELVRTRIARVLDPKFLAKLQKFEEVLGLSRPTELSPQLPAPELIDRLSRIDHAYKKYQSEKPKSLK
jgi:hypothetical protein